METFSLVEEVLFTYEVSYFIDVNLDPFLGKLVPRLGKKSTNKSSFVAKSNCNIVPSHQ
jgi:hypothetical protein